MPRVAAGSPGRPRRTQWLCGDTKPIRLDRSPWALLNAGPLVARTGSWGRRKLRWGPWSISGGVGQRPRGLSGPVYLKEHIQVMEPRKLYVTPSVTGQYSSSNSGPQAPHSRDRPLSSQLTGEVGESRMFPAGLQLSLGWPFEMLTTKPSHFRRQWLQSAF